MKYSCTLFNETGEKHQGNNQFLWGEAENTLICKSDN